MKISKIFHWLYAFLMSLPIVAVLTTSLYVVFNPNAMESTSITETQYRKIEYQTNEVNSIDDLVIGNVYQINFLFTQGNSNYLNIGKYSSFDFTIIFNYQYFVSCLDTDDIVIRNTYSLTTVNKLWIATFINSNTAVTDTHFQMGYTTDFNTYNSFPFIYKGGNININYIESADLSLLPPQYEEIETTTLDNAFSWAVNSINDNPLFSWASASFLVQPFHYIGNVFGLPITSPINTLLSYWLDISIIWLVYDLIMYLPLLIHRWLDKGVLE